MPQREAAKVSQERGSSAEVRDSSISGVVTGAGAEQRPSAPQEGRLKSETTGDWTDDYPNMCPKAPLHELYPGLYPKEKK